MKKEYGKRMAHKKMFITGVSGLLGSNFVYELRNRFEVIGTYNRHAVRIEKAQALKLNLNDAGAVRDMIKDIKPDIVVHGAACADVDLCEREPLRAQESNVGVTQNLVDALSGMDVKFVYISTDLVYSGDGAICRETDQPLPRNQYARTKLEGEQIALRFPGSLVLRTNLYGFNLYDEKKSLAEWLIAELSAGRSVKGFTDAIFSTLYTVDIAVLLERLIKADAFGIYNLGSSNCVSKYDFLVHLAQSMGFDQRCIAPVTMDSIPARVVRSKNLNLDTSKLQSVVGVVLTVQESIGHFVRDVRQGMSHDLRKVVCPVDRLKAAA